MAKIAQLSPHSGEFGLVQYLMQLQLDSPEFEVSEIYDISNKKQMTIFNDYVRTMKNTNIVDVFIPINDLDQPLSDIMSKGIKVHPTKGLRIPVDHIPLAEGHESYQAIHCIVALGKVTNFQAVNTDKENYDFSNGLPTEDDCYGYHSICINHDMDFVIFDQRQVKTLHLVRFLGGDNLSKNKIHCNICSVCRQPKATLWCENDSCKLCADCDRNTHMGNALMESHVRKPLKEAIVNVQMCPEHKNTIAQYYCPKCHVPICVECKINGSHSKGENAHHKCISLDKAYKDGINGIKSTCSKYTERKRLILGLMKEADDKLEELYENFKNVRQEINRLADKAIDEATRMCSESMKHVKSTKMELVRKLNMLEKMKDNIELHCDDSEPVQFLSAYRHYLEIEDENKKNTDLPHIPTVSGNLIVYGTLSVSGPQEYESGTERDLTPTFTYEPATTETVTAYTETNEESSTRSEEDIDEITGSDYSNFECKIPHYTKLSKIALRREKAHIDENIRSEFLPFEESHIIIDPKERKKLYLCLPFKGCPETHLMFATYRDGRSVAKLHKMVDDKGVTVMLIKVGENVFGGFAATRWNSDEKPFGMGSSSFLFSITRDAFIPYRPQSDEPIYLFGSRDKLSWGYNDLVIANSFNNCSTELENSYGIGLEYGSKEAATFLCGKGRFKADEVEVWGFFLPDQ